MNELYAVYNGLQVIATFTGYPSPWTSGWTDLRGQPVQGVLKYARLR